MDEHNETTTQETHKTTTTKPKGKKGLYIKIIALALCCALLGGVVGGGAVLLTGNVLADKEVSEFLEGHSSWFAGRYVHHRNPFAYRIGAFKDFIEAVFHETYIGASITDSSEPKGVLVNSVDKGSPAARGGLKEGDIITMVNNERIYTCNDLTDIIKKADSGDELLLTVYRNGETIDCTVTVGAHSRFGE